jgi:hypothetical protein
VNAQPHWKDIQVLQIGNRGDTNAWQADPRQALLQRHRIGLVMVPPVGLDTFIAAQDFLDTTTQFVHGAKGSGKTSLLLAKRSLLDDAVAERKLLCVPTGFPYVFSPFFDDTTVSFNTWESLGFADREAWKYLWLVLLGAFVLGAVDRDAEKTGSSADRPSLLSDRLVKAITGGKTDGRLDERQWLSALKNLVENTKGNPLESLRRIYESEVMPHLKGPIAERSKHIFVFVDGIDETFRGPGGSPLMKLVKEKKLKRLLRISSAGQSNPEGDPYKLARQLWANAQTSLLLVSTELLLQSNGFVRLIGSMRTEAYLEATREGAQANGQRADLVRAIQYTPDHLEAIVRANIRADLRLPTYDRPSKDDEFSRYFGASELDGAQIGLNEPIFQYLCRHSFAEPRDLMLMGNKLSSITPQSRRDPSRIHETVVSTTQTILTDYFQFMDEEWDKRFEQAVLKHIGRNILTLEDAQLVAREVVSSKSIAEKHPLCYLYKRGLIGVIDGKLKQVFQRIASVDGMERSKLPASSVYLVHPVLDNLVAQARLRAGKEPYQIVQGIAVGHGLPWIPGMRVKRVQLELDGSAVKLTINGQNLSEPMGSEPTFRSTTDIPTALLVACLEEMSNLRSNAPPIQSIMYNIDAMVEKGRLNRVVRRGGREKDTTNYISEFLVDASRQPPPFDTINARLAEYNLTQISISRSLRFGTLTLNGVDWKEVEVTVRA